MSRINTGKLNIEITGSSHGKSVSAKLSGIEAGEKIDTDALCAFMKRRSPGGEGSSPRKERDVPVIKSGISEGITDGSPIEIVIANEDARPEDYESIRHIPRPGHADYPAYIRSGGSEDLRGGGVYSGRMTAPLCAAGGIALQILESRNITIHAEHIKSGRDVPEGDSVGGIVSCTVTGLPIGLGGALFDGLEGRISQLVFAIPAVKGIEFGAGFGAAGMLGSENNDEYAIEEGRVKMLSNNSGGILGGISTGMPLIFNTAFKPTPSIALPQRSVNLQTMENVVLEIKGRHDRCVAPRAVPAVEAAAALAILGSMENGGISGLRSEIDSIDENIASLLSERFRLTDKIGAEKKKQGKSIKDAGRESEVLKHVSGSASEGCSGDIKEIYTEIILRSCSRQEKNWNTD